MLTTRALEKRLGITPPAIETLIAVGLIDPTAAIPVGNAKAWPESVAEDLDWPFVSEHHPPALNVKVKGRQSLSPDEAEAQRRDHTGWTPGLDPLDTDQLIGIDRWYRVGKPKSLIGHAFLVSTRSWILAPYTILDARAFAGLWRFELGPPTEEIEAAFMRRRLISRQGPLVERLPDTRIR